LSHQGMSRTEDSETGSTSLPIQADYGPEELLADITRHVSKLGSHSQAGFGLLVGVTLLALVLGARAEYLIGDAFCCFLFVKFVLLERRPRTLRLALLPATVICTVCWTMQAVSRSPLPGRLLAAISVWAWFFTITTCTFVLRRSGVSHGEDHQD
jgi:hypothetical protein